MVFEDIDTIVAVIKYMTIIIELIAAIVKLVESINGKLHKSKNDSTVYMNITNIKDSNIRVEGSKLEAMKSKGINSSNKDKIN